MKGNGRMLSTALTLPDGAGQTTLLSVPGLGALRAELRERASTTTQWQNTAAGAVTVVNQLVLHARGAGQATERGDRRRRRRPSISRPTGRDGEESVMWQASDDSSAGDRVSTHVGDRRRQRHELPDHRSGDRNGHSVSHAPVTWVATRVTTSSSSRCASARRRCATASTRCRTARASAPRSPGRRRVTAGSRPRAAGRRSTPSTARSAWTPTRRRTSRRACGTTATCACWPRPATRRTGTARWPASSSRTRARTGRTASRAWRRSAPSQIASDFAPGSCRGP